VDRVLLAASVVAVLASVLLLFGWAAVLGVAGVFGLFVVEWDRI